MTLPRVAALAGGVGGARMLDGMVQVYAANEATDRLTAIVNTGDDFEHWGLWITPDLDTVMYTLAGLAHEARGWGLRDETFACLERVGALGGDGWFQLGDRDLATHLVRTERLRRGEPLSVVSAQLFRALGVQARVLPMTDGRLRTMIDTRERGTLPFQDWLVKHRAAPTVARVRFEGDAGPAPGVVEAIEEADLVLVCPSNPYVSIDPILSLPGVRDAVGRRRTVAISPILDGRAVKGPLAEMILALTNRPASALAVAAHYDGLLTGMVVEEGDGAEMRDGGVGYPLLGTSVLMRDVADRARLAREVVGFAETLP